MADMFVREMGMLEGERGVQAACMSQFDVVEEEFEEVESALKHESIDDVAEEIADLIITARILGALMDIDCGAAYKAKMKYNMSKTGKTDENGKVQDDGQLEKPDFSQFAYSEKEW